MIRSRVRFRVVLGAALVALVACGESSVGNNSLFSSFKPQGSGGLGSATSTPAPTAAPTAAPVGQQTSRPAATHAATVTPRPPAATAQPQAFVIGIYADTNAQGYPAFNPPSANVYTGTEITWVNHDSVARSVVFDSGDPAGFNSGPIPPGGSASFTPTAAGKYSYSDGTRPYAVAQFQAVSR